MLIQKITDCLKKYDNPKFLKKQSKQFEEYYKTDIKFNFEDNILKLKVKQCVQDEEFQRRMIALDLVQTVLDSVYLMSKIKYIHLNVEEVDGKYLEIGFKVGE